MLQAKTPQSNNGNGTKYQSWMNQCGRQDGATLDSIQKPGRILQTDMNPLPCGYKTNNYGAMLWLIVLFGWSPSQLQMAHNLTEEYVWQV